MLEATYGWYWAADTLAEAARRCTWRTRWASRGSRTGGSRTTSETLLILRTCCGWAGCRGVDRPASGRELRELTRYRHKLVRLRTSCKDQVHAILAKLGIPVTCTDIFGTWGSTWLDGLALPQPYAGKMASLRKVCAVLAGRSPCWRPRSRAARGSPGLPRGPCPAGHRPGAGRGDRGRDRRHHPVPASGRAVLLGRADPRHRESDVKVSRGHITKQGSRILRWALVEAIQHVPAGHPCASARTTSSPAAAPRHATSPRSPRPASCSPGSSTPCATARSDPWPPPCGRPCEQARTRAARDRWFNWPPPPGGAAVCLIDPAARTRTRPMPPRQPAAGTPEGMNAAASLPRTRTAHGARHPATHTVPGPASVRRRKASVKVVRPAGRSTLTPAFLRRARNPDRNRRKTGTHP